jgi:hypothetical protein
MRHVRRRVRPAGPQTRLGCQRFCASGGVNTSVEIERSGTIHNSHAHNKAPYALQDWFFEAPWEVAHGPCVRSSLVSRYESGAS